MPDFEPTAPHAPASSTDDEWVPTYELVTPEQVAALNRLLAIRADEGLYLSFEDEDV